MGDGVAGQAVGAALEQVEPGPGRAQELLGPRPQAQGDVVAGLRRQGQVELGAGGRALAGLRRRSGARVQIAAVLVEVHDGHRGIGREGVEHPVAVVGVDVHVGHALHAVAPAQGLDGEAAVVVHAEAPGGVPARMVQAGDGHECTPAASRHHRVHRRQGGAGHDGGGLVDAGDCGGVAVVQEPGALLRQCLDPGHVLRRVEQGQVGIRGLHRLAHRHPRAQAAALELRQEGRIAGGAEGMGLAEVIAAQGLAQVHAQGGGHGPSVEQGCGA